MSRRSSIRLGQRGWGRRDDPTTVVDPLLRVKGVEQLGVADASVAGTFGLLIQGAIHENQIAPVVFIAPLLTTMLLGGSEQRARRAVHSP